MDCILTDIGSNTIRVNAYNFIDGEFRLITSKKFTASLAGFMQDGCLNERGIMRLFDAMRYTLTLKETLGIKNIFSIATASLRKANNRLEIQDRVKEEFGIAIQILSKYEEARLGFLGVLKIYGYRTGICIDIGGGSTELASFEAGKLERVFEAPQGSLSLYNEFVRDVLPMKKEVDFMCKELNKVLEGVTTTAYGYGIGGTNRAAIKVFRELNEDDSLDIITYSMLDKLIENILDRNKMIIKTIIKVVPERIHTLTCGMIILREIFRKSKIKQIEVCNTGIRDGYLADLLIK